MSWPKITVLIGAIAIGLFLFRYGSVDPCDWYKHDLAAKSGVPLFLLSGMLDERLKGYKPPAGKCFKAWVELHTKGLQK